MSDRADEERDDLGPLDDLIHEFRDRLKPDGPAVDYAKLYAYLTGALRGEDRDEVEQNLEYATWHDAYWTLQVQRRLGQEMLKVPTELPDPVGARADWATLAAERPDTGGTRGPNMTDLAMAGESSALELAFRECLPELLNRVQIPIRERSVAFCNALVAYVMQQSRNLQGRRFREALPDWLTDFATQRGIVEVKRLDVNDWKVILTEAASSRALACVEQEFGESNSEFFARFKLAVLNTSTSDRIPLGLGDSDLWADSSFLVYQRTYDRVAASEYEREIHLWEVA